MKKALWSLLGRRCLAIANLLSVCKITKSTLIMFLCVSFFLISMVRLYLLESYSSILLATIHCGCLCCWFCHCRHRQCHHISSATTCSCFRRSHWCVFSHLGHWNALAGPQSVKFFSKCLLLDTALLKFGSLEHSCLLRFEALEHSSLAGALWQICRLAGALQQTRDHHP